VDAESAFTISEEAVWEYIFHGDDPAQQDVNRVRFFRKLPPVSVLQCVLLLSLISSLVVFARAQNHAKVLGTIRQVTELSNIEARGALPVQLEAVVTYSDPEWGLLFVEDDTGAIYVNVHGINTTFPPGSRVRVDAVTGPGDVGTVLVNPHIQILGKVALPTAERRTLAEINAQKADSRFVLTRGVLRAGDQSWKRICFRVFDGDVSALVVVPQPASQEARRLVGATVHLRAVSGIHIDDKGRIVGALLFVNRLEDIEVEGGAAYSPNVLAVIVNKSNPVNGLSMAELRQILLGERKYWRGSAKIALLLPTVGTLERQTALRLVNMDESSYQKYWKEKSSAGEPDGAPATAAASGFAVNLVAETTDAIAVVPLGDVKGSVKMLRIDGFLPTDSAYPVH
jgi:hypothetical protein